ncbi:glycosyltransferase Gtf1 [Staphylococcus pragensis]|nr:glycosyltransferase Gtf1 [Staphylococcus pragensis]
MYFFDFISRENIQSYTSNMGFKDNEIIWLYQYFTDIKIAPTTYTLDDIIENLDYEDIRIEVVNEDVKRIFFNNDDNYITCYLRYPNSSVVNRAEFVSMNKLIRKDYYSYVRIFSEYYAPKDGQAKAYQRVFYNENGTVAYEEYINEDNNMYVFKDKILYSKEELIGYFLKKLNLSKKDILLIDRSTNVGQVYLENKGEAKIGSIIHAEHYNENTTNEKHILWNNHYEYLFNNAKNIDFFITATDKQNEKLAKQFEKYYQYPSKIYTIPVGNLSELKKSNERRKASIITASRLASEKHVDWLVKAVIKAHQYNTDITFDIYGEGGEKETLQKIINDENAEGYITLKGHQNLENIYRKYQLFISGSTSEGFGLTLMEAIGSGLGMIGFEVDYGNPTFIKNGENGYRISINTEEATEQEIVNVLANAVVKFFKSNIEKMSIESYKIAENFLFENIAEKWHSLIKEVQYD